jgi:hypothetical protein
MPQSGPRRKPCCGRTVRAPRLPGQEAGGPFPAAGTGSATQGALPDYATAKPGHAWSDCPHRFAGEEPSDRSRLSRAADRPVARSIRLGSCLQRTHRLIIEIDEGAVFLKCVLRPVWMPAPHLSIEDEEPELDAISHCLALTCNFLRFRGDLKYYWVTDKIVSDQICVRAAHRWQPLARSPSGRKTINASRAKRPCEPE